MSKFSASLFHHFCIKAQVCIIVALKVKSVWLRESVSVVRRVIKQAGGVKKWTCPVCKASIIHTGQSISRHMRELHSDGQPHNCPKCNRTYSSYHKMQRHLKSHGDTGGICHICGKVLNSCLHYFVCWHNIHLIDSCAVRCWQTGLRRDNTNSLAHTLTASDLELPLV